MGFIMRKIALLSWLWVACLATSASADITSWTGAAGDRTWSNAANWTNGVPTEDLVAVFSTAESAVVFLEGSNPVLKGLLISDGDWQFSGIGSINVGSDGFSCSANATLKYSSSIFSLGPTSVYGYVNGPKLEAPAINLLGGRFYFTALTGEINVTGGLAKAGTVNGNVSLSGNGFLNCGTINGNVSVHNATISYNLKTTINGNLSLSPDSVLGYGYDQTLVVNGNLVLDGSRNLHWACLPGRYTMITCKGAIVDNGIELIGKPGHFDYQVEVSQNKVELVVTPRQGLDATLIAWLETTPVQADGTYDVKIWAHPIGDNVRGLKDISVDILSLDTVGITEPLRKKPYIGKDWATVLFEVDTGGLNIGSVRQDKDKDGDLDSSGMAITDMNGSLFGLNEPILLATQKWVMLQPGEASLTATIHPASRCYNESGDVMPFQNFYVLDTRVAGVPEPATLAMLGLGSLLLTSTRRRTR